MDGVLVITHGMQREIPIRFSHRHSKDSDMPHLTRRLAAIAGAAVMATLALTHVAQAQTALPVADANVKPAADSFYTPPAASYLASVAPGTIVRYRALPASSLWADVKEGWQIMYRSTNSKDQPVAMVTTLLVPKTVSTTGKKLISYQSFYDSLTLNCSPSGLTLNGKLFDKTFYKSALTKGYYVTLSDYEGLESQWIAAKNTGHGVLDSIRAVEGFSKSGLSASTPVGLFGYSGGGFASMWAAELAAGYAPELNIVGAAGGGLPVNPINVAKKVDGTLFAGAYFGAVVGLSRAYPELDVDQYASDAGKAMIVDAGTRCLGGTASGNPELLTKYAYKKGTAYLKDPNFLDLPEMQAVNADNTMGKNIPKMPLYIWEGTVDELMPIADADNLVATYCAGGAKVQYTRLSGTGHVLGAPKLSDGLAFLIDRFNGKAATSTCK
jgi:pimeloyl-ACP methyl ester carboxylesterase